MWDGLLFSGKQYYWNAIVNAIAVGPYTDIHYSAPGGGFVIGPPLVDRVMSYNDAVDQMAYFLSEIGKPGNLNVDYNKGESLAYDIDAYKLLRVMGYSLSNYYSYHPKILFGLAEDGDRLIYVSGDYGVQRHAWVIDGCKYPKSKNLNSDDFSDVYYWCHWGWETRNDGYYNGDVYQPSSDFDDKYALSVIFGVKIRGRYSKK